MNIHLVLGAHLIAVNLGNESHGIYVGLNKVMVYCDGAVREQSIQSYFEGKEPWAVLYKTTKFSAPDSVIRARKRAKDKKGSSAHFHTGREFPTWCITGSSLLPEDAHFLNLITGVVYEKATTKLPVGSAPKKQSKVCANSLDRMLNTSNSHSELNTEKPKPTAGRKSRFSIGAHIKTPRFVYSHHGIYIGNNEVIHFSGFSQFLKKGPITKTTLEEFANGEKVTEVKHGNALYKGKPAAERAMERMRNQSNDKNDKYNLLFNNCEHFATWCVAGEASSKQIVTATTVAVGGTGLGVVVSNSSTKKAFDIVSHSALRIAGKQVKQTAARSLSTQLVAKGIVSNGLVANGVGGAITGATKSAAAGASSIASAAGVASATGTGGAVAAAAKGIAGAGIGGASAAGVAGMAVGGGSVATVGFAAVGAVAAAPAAPVIAIGAAIGALLAVFW